jgi:hypothetical protein
VNLGIIWGNFGEILGKIMENSGEIWGEFGKIFGNLGKSWGKNLS